MGSKKQTTTSKETATTQPNTPAYALPGIQNYYDQVGAFGQQIAANPSLFATPANDTQMGAINAANNLGGWQGGLNSSNSLANTIAGTALNPIDATYAQQAQLPQFQNANAANLGPAANATAASLGPVNQANAATLGPANQASVANLGPAQTYQASQYTAPTLSGANAAQATSQGYNPTTANAATVGQIERVNPQQAQAASLLDTPIQNYLNPVTNELVNTSLAGFDDNAARVKAAQAAQAAGAGAFGGSRYAIREAQTEADLARERAQLDAGLRSSAFDRATNLAAIDTGNRQNTNLFNTSAQNSALSQNANAYNTGLLTQAGFQQQANLANQDASNQAAAFGANAANTANLFNTGQTNQFSLAGADLAAQQGMFNANAANDAARYGADANNQFGLAQFGAQNNANLFNTQAANDFASQQAGYNQQANLFNTGAANDFASQQAGYNQQTNLANQAAQNAFGLQQGAFDQQANLFNAQGANDFGLAGANLAQQTNLANAGIANNTSQFNAGQQQQQIANMLAAAGLLSNNASTGANLATNDIATQLAAGNTQYGIDQANNLAPLTGLAAYSDLINPGLLQAISGQTINTSGTQTTKQSGGLLGQILGSVLQAAPAMLSDRRLKRDIERLGEMPDGLGVYRYNYLWDDPDGPVRTGVMADEVAELRPWALGPELGGFASVYYGRL